MNLSQRLERLEAARGLFDDDGIATMNGVELRAYVERTLKEQGGRDAVLSVLRADPAADPGTIKMVEDWPTWPL